MSPAAETAVNRADRSDERKRSNVTSACDRCRSKKKGCGGEKPTCSSCANAGLECVYSNNTKQRGPVAGRVRELELKVMWLEAYIVIASEQHSGEAYLLDHLRVLNGWNRRDWESLPDTFGQRFQPLLDAIQAQQDDKIEEVLQTGKRKRADDSQPPSIAPTDRQSVAANRATAGSSIFGQQTPVPATASSSTIPPSRPPAGLESHADGLLPSALLDEVTSAVGGSSHAHGEGIDAFSANSAQSVTNPSNPGGSLYDNPPPDTWAYLLSVINENAEASSSAFQSQAPLSAMEQSAPWQDFEDLFRIQPPASVAPPPTTTPQDSIPGLRQSNPSSSTVPLPPEDVQRRLIAIYLEEPDDFLQIIKRSDLIDYAEGRRSADSPSKLLLLALFGYCACLSPTAGGAAPNIDALGGNDQPGGSLSELWTIEARSIASGMISRGQVDLDTVKALCFIAMREMGKTRYESAWLWLGICIRAAQLLDLHTVPDDNPLWFSLAFLDNTLATAIGAPTMIHSQRIAGRRDLPSEGAVIRAVQLSAHLRDSPSHGDTVSSSPTSNLQQSLSTWIRSLPGELQFRLGENMPMDVAVLHLYYGIVNVMINCTRSYGAVPQIANPYVAAATGLRLMLETTRHHTGSSIPLLRRCPYLVHGIYAASVHLRAITLAIGIDNPLTKPLQDCYMACRDTLRSMAETWPLGSSCASRLEKILQQNHVDQKLDIALPRPQPTVNQASNPWHTHNDAPWAPGRDPFALLQA